MADVEKLVDFMLTKEEAERFMAYLEARGLKGVGLGQEASKFGLDNATIAEFETMKSNQVLSLFKEYFGKISIVTLKIAFEPSEGFLKRVKAWLERTIGARALVDVTTDAGLIGGAVLIANNHYRDYSIGSRLAVNS